MVGDRAVGSDTGHYYVGEEHGEWRSRWFDDHYGGIGGQISGIEYCYVWRESGYVRGGASGDPGDRGRKSTREYFCGGRVLPQGLGRAAAEVSLDWRRARDGNDAGAGASEGPSDEGARAAGDQSGAGTRAGEWFAGGQGRDVRQCDSNGSANEYFEGGCG